MPSPAQRLGALPGVAVALSCWILLAAIQLAGGFETLDLRLLDWRFQLRGARPPSDRIAVVEIDDTTVEGYGRWPLPRDQYALLIEALAAGRPRAVGMDLLFLGHDLADPRFDALLAEVTSRHPEFVHAVTFVTGLRAGSSSAAARPEVEALLARHGLAAGRVPAREGAEATTPEPGLLGAAGAIGHVVLAVDRDGVVRRTPLFVRHEGRLFPSLALAVTSRALSGASGFRPEPAPGGVRLEWPDRSLRVPLDREGAVRLDFAGDRSAFRRVHSMLDVLRAYAAGDTAGLRREFEGRVVLVGATALAQGATDLNSTPFSPATPLLYVHANAVDSFLRGRFLRRPPLVLSLAATGALAALLGWLFVALSLPWAAGAAALALLLVAAADQALFALAAVDVPPTAALALAPLAYAAIASYRFVFLEHRARERQQELDLARRIQQRLLPGEPPAVPGFEVAGVNLPAQEVGGDYYDWIVRGEGRLAVALADVSGHGVAAALLMSHLRASLHAETRGDAVPADVAQAMHASLYRAIEPGRFATFFLAELSSGDGRLRWCNAGHNPPYLAHGGAIAELAGTGLPLGMLEDARYTDCSCAFVPGDALVIYSDGLTEAERRGEAYGEDRLRARILALCARGADAATMVRELLADVTAFAGPGARADDVTILVARRT